MWSFGSWAPVEDENKPLDEDEIKIYRQKLKNVLCIEWIIIIVVMALNVKVVAIGLAVSELSASILTIVGKYKKERV